jgi:hypothetical protein
MVLASLLTERILVVCPWATFLETPLLTQKGWARTVKKA